MKCVGHLSGTYNTRDKLAIFIRRTRQWSTHGFHRVKQSSIVILSGPMNIIWIIVQAQELTHLIGVSIGGQNACILFLPVGRTCTFCWNHDGRWRPFCSADGARNVFRYAHAMNIKLVLAAIEMCIIVFVWQWYSVWYTIGIMRQAQCVCAISLFIKLASTDISCQSKVKLHVNKFWILPFDVRVTEKRISQYTYFLRLYENF